MTIEEAAGKLSGAKPRRNEGQDGYEALCFHHDDHNPSLHIWKGANGWIQVKCRSCGAGSDEFISHFGLKKGDLKWDSSPTGKKSRPPLSWEDDYFRRDGTYLFTKQRYGRGKGKHVIQCIKNRPGGDVLAWNLNDLQPAERCVLFKWPELTASTGLVHVCEGEPAVKALIKAGETATCQSGGAESASDGRIKWTKAHSAELRGRDIVVWADRDPVGEYYAAMVAKALREDDPARTVMVVQSATTGDGDDADDHYGAGLTWLDAVQRDDLLESVPARPGKAADKTPTDSDSTFAGAIESQLEGRERPEVVTNYVQYRDTMIAVFGAVVARNDPPSLFVRNGTLAMVARHGDDGHKIVDALDHDLRALAAEACDFVKTTKESGNVPADPPGKVEAMIRASRPWPNLPILEGLSQCPVLRSDWTFAGETGYDKDTRAYITEGPWPIRSEHSDPAAWLMSEVLGEFPFADDASLHNALALMLLPFVRRVIHCPTPVHYIEAPTIGTGKTLLAQTCLYPACGFVGASTMPEREEERKKSISSFLLEGAPAVIFDNLDKRVDSGTLAAATTNTRYHDRMLGSNAIIDVPVKCVWVMTGNNAELSPDMLRRTVLIKIDAQMERPSQGRSFTKDLMEWFPGHRRETVGACCQMILNWVEAGSPMFTKRAMGGFEGHSRLIGGILAVHGLDRFIDNRASMDAHSDPQTLGWISFHELVYETWAHNWWRVADVVDKADAIEELGSVLGTNPDGKRHRLGRALSKRNNGVSGGLKLVVGRDSHTKQAIYRLVPIKEDPKYDEFAEDEPGPVGSFKPKETGQASADQYWA